MALSKIDIRPGVSILAVLRHLNYKPWFAFGEFVDNALQSFLSNESRNISHKLIIDIQIDSTEPARISIKDNAFGISLSEFPRAFKPASAPLDNTGLSEFGMGMKSAACWFSPRWEVRTTVANEEIVRTIYFDIENMIEDNSYEVSIVENKCNKDEHYTEIILNDVFHKPVKKTIYKIKKHLASIYRHFIRDGILILRVNSEVLNFQEINVLSAPHFRNKNGNAVMWKKNINFTVGGKITIQGFAAIRAVGNNSEAGFSLFRRGRVIQGSADEGYRPALIFGNSNSYRYQRLFGELFIDGVEVSHTKDSFRWDELEQIFLENLRDNLDSDDMPLLRQAEGYRARMPESKLQSLVEHAVSSSVEEMKNNLSLAIPAILDSELIDTESEKDECNSKITHKEFNLSFRSQRWIVCIEISNDEAESQWLILSDSGKMGDKPRRINIRMSMSHPLMVQFAHKESDVAEVIFRIGAALSIAEVLARDSGVSKVGTVRRNMNDILRNVFSKR